MSYTITHRTGEMEADPPPSAIASLVDELQSLDPEHPDVSLAHESGWSISIFEDGLMVFENAEARDPSPMHLIGPNREDVLRLLHALSRGDIGTVQAEDWRPGYGEESHIR